MFPVGDKYELQQETLKSETVKAFPVFTEKC